MIDGNDYCNLSKCDNRIDALKVLPYIAELRSHPDIAHAVYLVEVDGRVYYELDHEVMIAILQKSQSRKYKTTAAQWNTIVRNLIWCANYYMLDPLEPLEPSIKQPDMTLIVDDRAYYGYQQLTPESDILTTTLVPSQGLEGSIHLKETDIGTEPQQTVVEMVYSPSPPPVVESTGTDKTFLFVQGYLQSLFRSDVALSQYNYVDE